MSLTRSSRVLSTARGAPPPSPPTPTPNITPRCRAEEKTAAAANRLLAAVFATVSVRSPIIVQLRRHPCRRLDRYWAMISRQPTAFPSGLPVWVGVAIAVCAASDVVVFTTIRPSGSFSTLRPTTSESDTR